MILRPSLTLANTAAKTADRRTVAAAGWSGRGRENGLVLRRPQVKPMASLTGLPILTLMISSILLLGAVALWDERRESAAALDDFAAEQCALAGETGAALVERLAGLPDGTPMDIPIKLLAPAARGLEVPGNVVVLFQRPETSLLLTTSGEPVRSPTIESALAKGEPWVRLSHEDAAALRLPARMAIAGLSRADAGPMGVWRVAVVTTALRVRDREKRAMGRLVLGFSLASAFIAAFGGLAQRKQKKELELVRSLARVEFMQERDERLLRADKLATLGALATGIAHEVSTPLGVIIGRAEQVLPKVGADERATRSVTIIIEQAERISHIVRALLRLARGGAPSLEKVEPARMASAAVDLVEHRFTKAEVTLGSELSRDLPRVACDRKLFEQVLVNLLLNACDACEPGGHVDLSVQCHGERVSFIVTDDGEGITPEVAARAIEPFFTTKSEAAGTGLGLAIANEIVKHHNGELALAPRVGARGTRATVELVAVRETEHGG
jgi:signal transduction histidine kinase